MASGQPERALPEIEQLEDIPREKRTILNRAKGSPMDCSRDQRRLLPANTRVLKNQKQRSRFHLARATPGYRLHPPPCNRQPKHP